MVNNWEEKFLGELCYIYIGKTPSRAKKNFWDKNCITNNTWLSIADLKNSKDKFVYSSKEQISNEGAEISKIVKKGTLLLSFKLTIGRVAFAGKDLYTNEAIAQLPIKEDKVNIIDKNYLFYYLQYFDYQSILKGDIKVKGKTLNKKKLEIIPIVFPAMEGQKRIIEKLDSAFQKIENLENNTKENIKNIEDLYNSYLNKIFTENTDDWEEKTLEELCYILDSKRVPITKKDRNAGIYPYYGATGIQDYIDSYIFDETLLLVGEDGAKWGRCENTAFIVTGKFWVNNHAHVLKIKKDTIYEWLKYYLNYTDLSEYITGTTVPKLNQEKLKQIKVPIPKIEEQKRIVDKLDICNNKIESIKQNYQNKLKLLYNLKKSILNKAFNGEL